MKPNVITERKHSNLKNSARIQIGRKERANFQDLKRNLGNEGRLP